MPLKSPHKPSSTRRPRPKVAARVKPKPEIAPPQQTSRYLEAIGRRKTAVARVRLHEGRGEGFLINGRDVSAYFFDAHARAVAEAPLRALNIQPAFFIEVKVAGGGNTGQAEAVRHGLSRALAIWNADDRPRLKKAGFLRRDPRMKERKKYGLKGARRAPQWQKR